MSIPSKSHCARLTPFVLSKIQSPHRFHQKVLLSNIIALCSFLIVINDTATSQELRPEVNLSEELIASGEHFIVTEHSPAIAISGNYAVAAWFIDATQWRVAWSYSTDGGSVWTYGGQIRPPERGIRVLGFPSVCVDSSGVYSIAALYRNSGQIDNIVVFNGRIGMVTEPYTSTFAIPFVVGNKYLLPRIACDAELGNRYLTYTQIYVGADNMTSLVYFTRSIGSTWSPPVLLSTEVCSGSRPIVGPDGEIYVIWQDFGLQQIVGRRSEDGGETFGPQFAIGSIRDNPAAPPHFVAEEEHPNPNYPCHSATVNFPSICVDQSIGPRRGTVYVAWADRVIGDYSAITTSIGETEPNGTIASADRLEIGQEYRGRAVSPDANMGNGTDKDFFYFDGIAGHTVCLDGDVTSVSPFSPGNFCLLSALLYTDFAVLWSKWTIGTHGPNEQFVFTPPITGRYYCYFASNGLWSATYSVRLRSLIPSETEPARDQRDVVLVSSQDGGQTWSDKKLVNDDPPLFDNYQPEVAVDSLGGLHVTWYDRRDDPARGADYNVYWRYSGDGALTFLPSLRLSSSTSVVKGTASYLGEYMGLASCATGVYAAWTQIKDGFGTSSGAKDHDIHVRQISVDREVQVQVQQFSATASPHRVRLAWQSTNPDRIWKFRIFRSATDSAEYTEIGEVDGSTDRERNYTLLDEDVQPGDELFYKIQTIQNDGLFFWSEPIRVAVPPRPRALSWRTSTPNPSSGHVVFELDTSREGHANITIFDVRGAEVRSLFDGVIQPGTNQYVWDGRNNSGGATGKGIYFLQATVNGEQARKKIVRTSQ